MEKHRAIPEGYMTVGQLAKKMNTTVRTLQYYHKEGLLSPSAATEGGRRLYTDQDIVLLHQIQSMKYLGFSLDDIKNRLVSLHAPADVAAALAQQAAVIREKIDALAMSLKATEALQAEVLQMQSVDFKKYADIIVNLQMNNEFYWLIKHMDDQILDHLRGQFDLESGMAVLSTLNRLCDEAATLQEKGVPPQSEQGQAIGKAWWGMVTDFTGGDLSLLPALIKFSEKKEVWNGEWKTTYGVVEGYLSKAMEAYFTNLGVDPFAGIGVE